MNRFEDRTAYVTGAASGLGAATAVRLASEGATVVCIDLDEAGAQATAKQITSDGGAAHAVSCDVRSAVSVETAVAAALEAAGPPDIVANVAGVLRFAHTHESSPEDWELVIGVNLTGTYLMSRYTLPYLLENKGTIINIASTAGLRGQAYAAAYCASKGGVIQLTRQLAEEYKAAGVRINAVAPGGMDTPMVHNIDFPDGIDMNLLLKHTTPFGSVSPDDVASTVAFLASDEASYMTGAIVVVDGGITV